jgi:hypothetical protein
LPCASVGGRLEEDRQMRLLLGLIVIAYLIGVGVALAPIIRDKWNTATASEFTTSVAGQLPYAFGWPVRAYYRLREQTG